MGTIKITCDSGEGIVLQDKSTNKVFGVLDKGEVLETSRHDFFITSKGVFGNRDYEMARSKFLLNFEKDHKIINFYLEPKEEK